MKGLIAILLLASLCACGSAVPDKKPADDHASEPLKTPIGQSEIPTTRPSMLVETLPGCSASEEGWIVYLKPAAALEACEDGAWVVIELRGRDGVAGKDGKAGADGSAGKDGAIGGTGTPGATGATGAAGAEGKPLAPNLWPDPITGSIWLLATTDNTGGGVCAGEYRLPTGSELGAAAAHGIYGAFSAEIGGNAGFDCGWILNNGTMFGTGVKPGVSSCGFYAGAHALPWGVYCVKPAA